MRRVTLPKRTQPRSTNSAPSSFLPFLSTKSTIDLTCSCALFHGHATRQYSSNPCPSARTSYQSFLNGECICSIRCNALTSSTSQYSSSVFIPVSPSPTIEKHRAPSESPIWYQRSSTFRSPLLQKRKNLQTRRYSSSA